MQSVQLIAARLLTDLFMAHELRQLCIIMRICIDNIYDVPDC